MLKNMQLLIPEYHRLTYGYVVQGYTPPTKVEFPTNVTKCCKEEKVTSREVLKLLPHCVKGSALAALESQAPSKWSDAIRMLLKVGKSSKELADAQQHFFRIRQKDNQTTEGYLVELNRASQATNGSLRKQVKIHHFVQKLHPALSGIINTYWDDNLKATWIDVTDRALKLSDPYLSRPSISRWDGSRSFLGRIGTDFPNRPSHQWSRPLSPFSLCKSPLVGLFHGGDLAIYAIVIYIHCVAIVFFGLTCKQNHILIEFGGLRQLLRPP